MASNHPDEQWQKRTFGVYHTSNGRKLPTSKKAALSTLEQEKNLSKFDRPEYQHHSDSMKFDPVEAMQRGASQYANDHDMGDPHRFSYHDVQTSKANVRAMGRAYEAAPERQDLAVPHYRSLRNEVNKQFDHLTGPMGVHVEVTDHDPYNSVHSMVDDLRNNNRLKVLSTKTTGGHPYFTDDENDAMRAVHDAFGHAATGRGFDVHGEEGAYAAHSRMFSQHALPAMQSETRAQNAYLHLNGNFSDQKLAVLPPHLQQIPIIGGRSYSKNLHVASIEDLIRQDQGKQHVSDVTVGGQTSTLCHRHIQQAHEMGALQGQIARATGIRDENTPEPHTTISDPYRGNCSACTQEQRKNSQRPWDANKSMHEKNEMSEMRPSKPSTRGLYPNPGSWPYNPNRQTKEFVPTMSPHMSSRVAVRKSFKPDDTSTGLKAFASHLSNKMPNVVGVEPMTKVAHDSGDHETIFHCFTGDVRYITKDGVKDLASTAGTTQWVLTATRENPEQSYWVEAEIKSFGITGPLFDMVLENDQGEQRSVCSTDLHNWFLDDGSKTQTFIIGLDSQLLPIGEPDSSASSAPHWRVVSVDQRNNPDWDSEDPDSLNYLAEEVFCAVVPDTARFALEGYILTGNCPFDGSGNVVANSDGTISCEFCNASFNVIVQPNFPNYPQTINGAPVNVPMGPDWDNSVGVTPESVPADDAEAAPEDQDDPQADQGDGQEDADQAPPFQRQSSFRTASGAELNRDAYIKHLALHHSHDVPDTLNKIRQVNAGE